MLVPSILLAGALASDPATLFKAAIARIKDLDSSVARVMLKALPAGRAFTGCGEAPTGDLVAFYCPLDRTIHYRSETLRNVQAGFGPPGLFYLASHELAHGRQHALTGFAASFLNTKVLDELQADCVAGSYLNQAFNYNPSSAEGEVVMEFARNIGDYSIHERDWHGTPAWRAAAVRRGLNKGIPAQCLSSSRFNYGQLINRSQNIINRFRLNRQQ